MAAATRLKDNVKLGMYIEERFPDGTKGKGPGWFSYKNRRKSTDPRTGARSSASEKGQGNTRRNVLSFRVRCTESTSARDGNRRSRLCLCEVKGVDQSGIRCQVVEPNVFLGSP